ncbi:hypothetical protein TD95_000680, partial [Thielaviopsis punctulata]
MDAFVVRKRKRNTAPPPAAVLKDKHDNEPTDVKLALLASRFPLVDTDILLDLLTASDGSLALATSTLQAATAAAAAHDGTHKPSAGAGHQATLRSFCFASDTGDGSEENNNKKKKRTVKKGVTLHLYDCKDVEEYTPCTIIHNFLPAQQADALLMELVAEAETFQKRQFKLFDNVCQSPHTSAMFVESYDEMRRQQTEYIYNGERMKDVRKLTPHLTVVKPLVAAAVNSAIQARIASTGHKLRFQSPDAWAPNVALVNCYRGARESVGWHSDQMTYLGPRAVIGSLSLGVTREFRVRRVVAVDGSTEHPEAKESQDDYQNKDNSGQISIHLPHNSLLIMHADMQEEWKHTIAPAQTIDPHPRAGNVRINVTYRDYKEYMHPRYTPRCKCNTPCVLRVVQRKRDSKGRYFWMCYASNVPGQESCDFFEWAEFDDDGRPVKRETSNAKGDRKA